MFLNPISTIIAILSLVLSLDAAARYNNVVDVDFIQSMTDGNPNVIKHITSDPSRAHYLKVFQENYEAKKPSKMLYSDTPIIPKIMHQIWDGPIPPLYQNYLDECKKLHPDWEFKIWSDKDAENLDMIAKAAFEQSRAYIIKADILRYEVLYKFGGVYRDMDVKCYKPLDDLNHMYEMYSNLERPFGRKYPLVNIALLGSVAQHPFLFKLLNHLKDKFPKLIDKWDNDPKMLKSIYPIKFAFEFSLTGFIDLLVKDIKLEDKIGILPASYFYPICYYPSLFKYKNFRVFSVDSFDVQSSFYSIKPETMASHNSYKREIRESDFDQANALGLHRKKILASMPILQQKMYSTYRAMYNENIKKDLNWNQKNKIPNSVHFIVFNFDERKKVEQHLPAWRMLNGNCAFKIWSKEEIAQQVALDTNDLDNSENLRLYLGLLILEKLGGNYAYFDVKPHQPIFELANKFNFYAGLNPITDDAKIITLSHNLIGAAKENPIIKKTLAELNFSNLNQIDQILAKIVYENIYLHGKNVVMPASYFESLKHLEESWLEKIIRFYQKEPTLFIDNNPNSIVE